MRRERISYVIKVSVSYALYYMGLMQLWQVLVLRRKAVVLMYHRVLSDVDRGRTGSHPGIVVTCETFERQMALLKRRFVVLPVHELARRIANREPLPNSSCVITFDDGWSDNFTNALPVLREHGLPAVVFLPVNYIGQRRLFWREAITHMLVEVIREVRRNPGRLALFKDMLAHSGLQSVLHLSDENPRPEIIEAVASNRELTWERANALLVRLCAELGMTPDKLATPDDFMDWAQVKAMGAHNVAFGGHGADHRILTELSGDEAEGEIRYSRQHLDDALAGPVPTFSYPNGAWTPDIAAQVEQAGFALAFTTQPGFVTCDDDAFRLKRVNIHEDVTNRPPLFLARLIGLF